MIGLYIIASFKCTLPQARQTFRVSTADHCRLRHTGSSVLQKRSYAHRPSSEGRCLPLWHLFEHDAAYTVDCGNSHSRNRLAVLSATRMDKITSIKMTNGNGLQDKLELINQESS